MSIESKFCKDCKHSRHRTGFGQDGWSVAIRCFYPANIRQGVVDLVSDEVIFVEKDNQILRAVSSLCGPEGAWYEQRVTFTLMREDEFRQATGQLPKRKLRDIFNNL